jgi:hypothetical protein
VAYWDPSLTRNFVACPEEIKLPKILWASGEPSNTKKEESCTALNFKGNITDIGLDDISCFQPVGLLCQVIFLY